MRFKTFSFKELLVKIVDNRGKTCPVEDVGIPLIATNCIKENTLYPVFEKVRYVSDEIHASWFRGHPEPGDMIFVCKGSPGRVSWVPDPVNFCIAQDMVAIRGDEKIVYPRYLFAMLRSKITQQKILNMHVGTLIPHFKKGDFGNLYFDIPEDMEYQRRVGDMYFDVCLKIEANTQTNQTLEAIAQALFKSWFVDFDPVKAKMAVLAAGGSAQQAEIAAMGVISAKSPEAVTQLQQTQPEEYAKLAQTAALFPSSLQASELGEIPAGWGTPLVQDVADIIKGKSYKSAELDSSDTALVTLKSFKRGGGYRLDGLKEYIGQYKCEQEVFAGDLIIAYTDVTQAADVIGKPAMVISDKRYKHLVISLDVAVIRPSNDDLKYYLYGLTKTKVFQQHTNAHSTGTTVLHLSKNAVPKYRFILANSDVVSAYVGHVQPIFLKINETIEENTSLSILRDTLLPKLLAGELDLTTPTNKSP